MIPLRWIDRPFAVFGLLFFAGAFHASLTTFDSVGGANSAGNINIQLFSICIYSISILLIMARFDHFLWICSKNTILLLFLLIPIFSIAWSVAPDVTLRRTIALLGTTFFAFYIASAFPPQSLLRITAFAFGVITIVSFFFIFALPHYGTHQSGTYSGVWRGVFAHKNKFGGVMVLSVVTLFICPVYNEIEKITTYIISLMALFAVFLSQSQSSLVALIGMFTIMLTVQFINGKGIRTVFRTILLLIIGVGSAFVATKYTADMLTWLGKNDTLTGRTETWNLAWDRALDRPALGYGYRAFWTDQNPARRAPIEGWRDEISHAHNTYFDLLLELGFFGFAAFSLLLIILFFRLLARCMKIGDSVNVWFFAIIFYILARGLVEVTILQQADITWVFFAYMFIYLAIHRWKLPAEARVGISTAYRDGPTQTQAGAAPTTFRSSIGGKPGEQGTNLSRKTPQERHAGGRSGDDILQPEHAQSLALGLAVLNSDDSGTARDPKIPRISRTSAQCR